MIYIERGKDKRLFLYAYLIQIHRIFHEFSRNGDIKTLIGNHQTH